MVEVFKTAAVAVLLGGLLFLSAAFRISGQISQAEEEKELEEKRHEVL